MRRPHHGRAPSPAWGRAALKFGRVVSGSANSPMVEDGAELTPRLHTPQRLFKVRRRFLDTGSLRERDGQRLVVLLALPVRAGPQRTRSTTGEQTYGGGRQNKAFGLWVHRSITPIIDAWDAPAPRLHLRDRIMRLAKVHSTF